jgi:hypothetical protein
LKYICKEVFVFPSSFLFGLWVIFVFHHVIILCGIVVVSLYGIVCPFLFIFMHEVLYAEGHKPDQGSGIQICRYKKSHNVEA